MMPMTRTVGMVVFLVLIASVSVVAAEVRTETVPYKTVETHEIKADVIRPDGDAVLPVVVWIHGGALINGHRAGISNRVKEMMLGAGYAIVSIDYRLAPETKLPAIIEDVEDAFTWLHSEEARKRFRLDTSKVAVMGGSAGGYLTLTAGFRAKPRPAVLVSFWGYGDLIGDWYSKPSPHPRHNSVKLDAEEAYGQVRGSVVSDSRERKGDGGAFYQFCRQRGLWPKAVSGWDPAKEADRFYPFMPVKNVTADYPPTLLIHGTNDTDVPYEQSLLMAEQFQKHRVEHRLVSVPKAEHGLEGGDPKEINAAYKAAFDFIHQHMTKG